MQTNKPSLQLYDQLYLKTGIRVASQLMQAKSVQQDSFFLPKAALYHYVDTLGSTVGPSPADTLFRAYQRNIFITYTQSFYPDYTSKARYRVLPGLWDEKSPSVDIKHYHAVNKRMRRVVSFDQTLMDENIPLVISYARIPKHYDYMDNIYRKHYQWEDLYHTVFRKIQEVNDSKFFPDLRQQFISVEVPGTLVPFSVIENTIKQGINTTHLAKIGNDGQRFMTHLLWSFSDRKEESVFAHIKTKDSHKVTLLLTHAGKVVILNYGMLLSMCENKNYSELFHKKKQQMSEQQMRRYIYLMFMNIIGQTNNIDEGEEVTIADKDKSANALETAVALAEEDEQNDVITKETLAAIDEAISDSENISQVKVITTLEKQPPQETLSQAFEKQIQRAAMAGSITSTKQIQALSELSTKYENIVLSDGKKFKEAVVVKEEDKVIKPRVIAQDITTLVDPSMQHTNVENIHQQYISKVMRPHILSTIASVQRAGVMVEGIEEKDVSDITGEVTQLSVQLKPIVGKKSTVHMKIPKVQEDGTFTVNGTTYRLSNQLTDAPIRKVSLDKVVLSSAYGRVFITKNDYSRNNYTNWICDGVMALAQDEKSNIKAISIGDCTEPEKEHSKSVTALKTKYRLIQTRDYTFYFDDALKNEKIKGYPRSGHYWCGLTAKNELVGLDKNDFVYIYDAKGNISLVAHIEEVLGLDRSTRPIQYAMFTTAGVDLPLGIVMATIYGMDNLIALLNTEVKNIPRSNWNKEPISSDEFSIDFADVRLVFKNSDSIAELIIGGLTKYYKSIKEHDLEFFNKTGSFAAMLSKTNMGSAADSEIRNIRFMDDMFVDPITQELLVVMKEPTSFRGLLHRSAELLSTGQYSREFMLKGQMRVSGYERFSMAIYKELCSAIRAQSRAIARQNKPISLNPNAVWMNITSDPAKSVVNDINPIEYLKGSELLTFSGHGGRSKETMVASTRIYDDSYMGVVSEATVDSGDVGIRSYLSVNPDIKDIYGFTGEKTDYSPSSIYSTSALLFANSDKDD